LEKDILSEDIADKLKIKSYFFSDLLREYSAVEYRTFLLAWSDLRNKYELKRDKEGRYLL